MILISQSLIKAYDKVKRGAMCPLRFDALYVSKTAKSEPSEAMRLGHYFEYIATGNLPKEGYTPEPVLLKSGANAGKPNADYARAIAQAENFKADLAALGFTIKAKGVKLMHPVEEDIVGEADLLAEHKTLGECLIDLKYSGLINNKWDELGWEEPEYKTAHMIQAVHYKFIKRIPFFFAVYSSANDWERKWLRIEVDPDQMTSHYALIQAVRSELASRNFQPVPDFKQCLKCEIADICKKRRTVPEIETVHYPA